MIFFILVFVIHLLINIYIFIKGWKAVGTSYWMKITYCAIYSIFFSSFVIAMLGRNALPLEVQKPLYFIGTSWLAVMLYLTFYFLLTDLIKFLDKKMLFFPFEWVRKKETYPRIQVISGYVLVAVILICGYIKFMHPEIVRQDIVIEKQAGEYKNLKVVGISDLHLGITVDKGKLKKYVELINAQNPDMVLIAGDLIDNNLRPLNEEKMWEEINRINAPLGIYMCLGNHEHLSGIEESLDFLKKTKIHLLIDDVALVDNSFYIIGREDRINKNRESLEKIVSKTDSSYPLILLDHQPYDLEVAESNGIDLQFSGHTHDGQLFPLNLIAEAIYEVGHGYKQKGKTHFYVSSGLGLWGPEFRIGTQSELVVFNIQFK